MFASEEKVLIMKLYIVWQRKGYGWLMISWTFTYKTEQPGCVVVCEVAGELTNHKLVFSGCVHKAIT